MRWILIFGLTMACQSRNDVLFYYGENPISSYDLPYQDQIKIYEAERKAYEQRIAVIADFVIKRRLQEMAKSESKSLDEITERVFPTTAPSDEALMKLYQQMGINLAFESIRDELVQEYQRRETERQKFVFLKSIEKDVGFYPQFSEPQTPTLSHMTKMSLYSWGPESAKVTVVQVLDFTCPHCQKSARHWMDLIQDFPDVRFDILAVALKDRPDAIQAMLKGICSAKLGDFPEFFRRFSQNEALDDGIKNKEAFYSCLSSSETQSTGFIHQKLLNTYNIRRTPTFFLNGKMIETNETLDTLRKAITDVH